MDKIYDLIIIGSGPAGLAASLYASRYKLEHMIFGSNVGGQITEIKNIENWPGETSISGADLIAKFVSQVESYGVKITAESVADIKKNDDGTFEISTGKNIYSSKTILMAMGAEYRRINIPGEKEFTGKGVSYCATCDGFFFKNKTVAVVGGGNSAAVAALEMADIADKVYIIFRKEKMAAEPYWMDKINANEKITLVKETNIIEVKGDQKLERAVLDVPFNDKTYLELDGIFVEVGSDPGIGLARKIGLEIDEQNYIKVKPDQSTSIPGLYAAGDITDASNKFRQVLTAASEGSIAASSAYRFVKLK